eukprot:5041307-Amphidinium_carterae.1
MSIRASFRHASSGSVSNAHGMGKKLQATAVCKVLQTQSSYGFLIHLGGQPLLLHGSLGTALQLMETTSGEVIFKALKEQNTLMQRLDMSCKLKSRLVCTDSHKAVKKAEELLVQTRLEWLSLHLVCEAHLAAIVLKRTLALATPIPSSLLHMGLALRGSSGNYLAFRKALAATIVERLQLLQGKPTAAADAFREASIALFTEGRPHQESRAAVLRCCVNGDWSKHGVVQHYLAAGSSDMSKAEVAKKMTDEFLWALLPCVPALCKTKGWGDVDHALCDLGLVAACHGLLEPAFTLFCRLVNGGALFDHRDPSADTGCNRVSLSLRKLCLTLRVFDQKFKFYKLSILLFLL